MGVDQISQPEQKWESRGSKLRLITQEKSVRPTGSRLWGWPREGWGLRRGQKKWGEVYILRLSHQLWVRFTWLTHCVLGSPTQLSVSLSLQEQWMMCPYGEGGLGYSKDTRLRQEAGLVAVGPIGMGARGGSPGLPLQSLFLPGLENLPLPPITHLTLLAQPG